MKIKEFSILKKKRCNQNLSVEKPTNSAAEPRCSLEEMLVFYMKQARNLGEELAQAKVKLEQATVENQTLKGALKAAEKKIAKLEKKNMRLAAIEKVWEETFSKIKLVVSDVATPNLSEEQDVFLPEELCAVDYEE